MTYSNYNAINHIRNKSTKKSCLIISDSLIISAKVKDVQNIDFIEIKEQKTQKYKRFPVIYAYKANEISDR